MRLRRLDGPGLGPLILVLLAAACAQQPGGGPNATNIPPPANLEPSTSPRAAAALAPPAPGAAGWDGNYAGEGYSQDDPEGLCQAKMRVYGMEVSGRRVHFGSFRGDIEANGAVRLVAGQTWIFGRFANGQFTGTVWNPRGCTYRLVLSRS